MSERARKLFDQILLEGTAFFDRAQIESMQESEILEFKQLGNNRAPMTRDDRRNLAIGLGGFHNSGGGVLVFGVNCRNIDGVDTVESLHEIENLSHFLTQVNTETSQLVNPGIEGLEPALIKTGEDKGFMIIFVPKGDSAPVMSTGQGQHGYYYRAGTSFLLMSHDMLMDRINRRPLPRLRVIAKHVRSHKGQHERIHHLVLGLENYGRGMAVHPAVRFEKVVGIKLTTRQGLRWIFRQPSTDAFHTEVDERKPEFIGLAEFPIHPQRVEVFAFAETDELNHDDVEIDYLAFCDGYSIKGKLEIPYDDFAAGTSFAGKDMSE